MKSTKLFSFLLLMMFLLNVSAQSPTLVLQKGHLRTVNSARFSPDGRQIVTTSDDGIIKIWDVFSQKIVNELGGNGVMYVDAFFSPEGKHIVAKARRSLGVDDASLREYDIVPYYVWNLETNRLVYASLNRHESADLSPGGKWMVYHPEKTKKYTNNTGRWHTVQDGAINIYSASTRLLLKQLTQFEDITTEAEPFVEFLSDSTLLIIVQSARPLHRNPFITKFTIYNFNNDAEVATHSDTSDVYKSGQWLISATRKYLFHYRDDTYSMDSFKSNNDAYTELWDLQHLKMIWEKPIKLEDCSFSKNDSAMLMVYKVPRAITDTGKLEPYGKKIAHLLLKDTVQASFPTEEYDYNVVSTNGNVQLYYATAEMQLQDKDTVCSVIIRNNAHKMISSFDTKIPVSAMTFSPNDKLLITGFADGNISVWDFSEPKAKEVANSINVIDPIINMHTSETSSKIWYITKSMYGMQDVNSIDKLSFISTGDASVQGVHYLLKDKYSILDLGELYQPSGSFMIINNDTPSVVTQIHFDTNGGTELVLGDNTSTSEKPGDNNKQIKLQYPGLQSFTVYTTSSDMVNPNRKMFIQTAFLMSGVLKSTRGIDTTLLFGNQDNMQYNDELKSYIFTYEVPYAIRKAAPKDIVNPILPTAVNTFLPNPRISDNGKYFLGRDYKGKNTDQGFYYCQDMKSNLVFKTPVFFNGQRLGAVSKFVISPDGKLGTILSDPLLSLGGHFVRVINTQNGTPLYNLKMNAAGVVNGAVYTPDSKYLYTWSEGGTLTKWNLTNGREVFTMVFFKDHDYAIILPAGYYYISSRTDAKYLNFKVDDKLYNFSQFDLQFNRPDRVLRAIGCKDENLINEYFKAWLGRIRKNGFSIRQVNQQTLHVPSVVVNSDNIQPFTSAQNLRLAFTVSDSLYKIHSYNVFINDVPINGINGRQLVDATNSANLTEAVLLSEGMNKIEVSCTNENGVVSRKEAVYITYKPSQQTQHKVYFIGIGINNYSAHSSFVDLSYCVKDIRDLTAALKQKFSDMVIDTLMNEAATRENVLALKQKLMNTSVDDKVIVSFSGHGMVDPQHPDDFYFVTGNTGANDPSVNGISYAQLEDLLDSIPARKKLMLLDACHSGESDGSANNSVNNIPGTKKGNDDNDKNKAGSIEILDVVENTDPSHSSSTDIFKLMKEAFVDIRRNNGAYVLSAAQSNESAGEGGGITNGWFTSCIIALLQQNTAMSINELSVKVNQCVSAKSGGNQNTDNRQELAEFNWMLWGE